MFLIFFPSDVKRVLVVVSDGETTGGAGITEMYATPIKSNNIEIFAVAKDKINQKDMNALVSQPAESHIFTMKSYKDIHSLINDFVERVCQ